MCSSGNKCNWGTCGRLISVGRVSNDGVLRTKITDRLQAFRQRPNNLVSYFREAGYKVNITNEKKNAVPAAAGTCYPIRLAQLTPSSNSRIFL